MKKLLIMMALILFSFSLKASVMNSVKIDEVTVKKADNSVLISFSIVPQEFKTDYKVTLTPILYNDDSRSLELAPVTIVGKKRNISDQRIEQVVGDRRIYNKKETTVINYETSIAFEDWMQLVSVTVDEKWAGCCTEKELPRKTIADQKLLYYEVKPYFNTSKLDYELTELEQYDLENPFLHPMEDYNKRYDILLKDRDKGSSMVFFKVGKHEIDMNFQGNSDILGAIEKAFELIESDPNATLKHIMVAGYASPEGSLAFNTKLAQNRAESVKSFIKSRLTKASDNIFELYNGREDWDGLREKVYNSSMPERQEILDIIDAYTMEQEIRKTKLKQLKGGEPYKYMLENFYPPLRNAGYVQVYYEIDRKATVATAVTDRDGRTTWIDPDSPANRGVTAINKAIDLMVDHKFEEALNLLLEFKDDKRAYNNIGVCYMMMGDYNQADKYFEKAVAEGDEDAAKNMEETKWARKVEK